MLPAGYIYRNRDRLTSELVWVAFVHCWDIDWVEKEERERETFGGNDSDWLGESFLCELFVI